MAGDVHRPKLNLHVSVGRGTGFNLTTSTLQHPPPARAGLAEIHLGMDTGHYNCRDYYISPHFAPTTLTNQRSSFLSRHESFDQLEERSRSPKSQQPKFPLLSLPLELRQYIYSFLLPRTQERSDPSPLTAHARNFSAVKKRVERGLILGGASRGDGTQVVWKRGNIHLLGVCKQIHDECAELLYGSNTFLLFVTYSGITFRFNWRLATGMAPQKHYNFLELMPKRYLALIKKVVVNVDHTDDYTGMIKFNVQGKGLTHGLRKQVGRLVMALQPVDEAGDGHNDDKRISKERRLASVKIRVSYGNTFLESIKPDGSRPRKRGCDVQEDVEEMLQPFADLRGVRDVNISGAVTGPFVDSLRTKMMSNDPIDTTMSITLRMSDLDMAAEPRLCVYGNDI